MLTADTPICIRMPAPSPTEEQLARRDAELEHETSPLVELEIFVIPVHPKAARFRPRPVR